RHRRGLAAMDQLRRAAAGDAAHDRARALPLRHQLPRIRRGRHRRRRRHRRHAQHRVRPLRVRFRRRDPADHHRHRHGGGIFVRLPAALGAVMAVAIKDGTKVWQRRDRKAQFATWGVYLIGVAIFVYCWELISEKTIWAFVWDAPDQAADLGSRMVPPDWASIHGLWWPIWDTLNIATLGTVMAIILAVPVAYCAARNTTPSVALVR